MFRQVALSGIMTLHTFPIRIPLSGAQIRAN